MDEISLGRRIAKARWESGLTQEEVAAHLGVTKAAVSKWERGRSLPDLALAPKLAALFALSVDELIGYEPQMPQERVDATYEVLLARFEEDPASALEAVRAEAVRWWSCPALLLALGMLLYGRAPLGAGAQERPMTGEARACAELGRRVLERVRAMAPESEEARRAVAPLATLLQWLGEDEDALALLAPYLPGEPVPAATVAAQVYCQRGDDDAAARVLQHALLCAALEAVADVQALAALYGDDPERLGEVAAVAEGLAAVPGMTALAPTLLPMTRRALAVSLLPAVAPAADAAGGATAPGGSGGVPTCATGDAPSDGPAAGGSEDAPARVPEDALVALERFADAVAACSAVLAAPENPSVLWAVDDLLWAAPDSATVATRVEVAARLASSLAASVTADPRWAPYADDPRVRAVQARLSAL